MAVVVHGEAVLFALGDAPYAAFRDYCVEVYVPLYGERWTSFVDSPDIFFARIDATHMFTFRMERAA
jgi:hypothetical protein